MSLKDIEALKIAWVTSVKRALTAGFDVIEIHNGVYTVNPQGIISHPH